MAGKQGHLAGSHGVTTTGDGKSIVTGATFGAGGRGMNAVSGDSAPPIIMGQKPSVKTANSNS